MKRKIKYTSSIFSFLERKGVLDTMDTGAIETAKKEYWTAYRRQWKKAKRQQSKSYTILLSDQEANLVIKEAKRYHTSPTGYIKRNALTVKQMADPVAVGELRELLYSHYNSLQAAIDTLIIPAQLGHCVLEEITEIEKKLFALFSTSK
jgi:hypothetical protein